PRANPMCTEVGKVDKLRTQSPRRKRSKSFWLAGSAGFVKVSYQWLQACWLFWLGGLWSGCFWVFSAAWVSLLALSCAGFESSDCLLESWVRISALSPAGYSLSALLAVHGAWAYWLLMVAGSLLVSSAD
ncbi:hypothetical protein H0E87_021362, partial [Populus deltoides]